MFIGLAGIAILGIPVSFRSSPNIQEVLRPVSFGIIMLLCAISALIILHTGRLGRAVLVAAIGLQVVLALNFNGLGIRAGAGVAIAFVLPITMAGFLMRRRVLIFMLGLTFASVLATATLEQYLPGSAGYAAPQGLSPETIISALFMVLGLLGIFTDQVSTGFRKALRESLARERELERIGESLEARTVELSQAKEALEYELAVRREAEAALTAERDLLHALMDNLPDTIYFKDLQSRFTRINRAQARILGVRAPEEAVGKTDFDFQAPELAKSFYEEEQHLIASGEPLIDRLEFSPLQDGRPRWLSVTKVPMKDKAGQVVGMIGVSRDITVRHEIERMKNEFITTVSHELRTPLTSIRGALSLLAGGTAGEVPLAAKAMIDIAHKNSERLTRLVDDILDIEKIESGKLSFRVAQLELAPLVEQAIEANRGYGEQYHVTFALTSVVPGALVHIDGDRLMQVLANLLSNAAKFSPAGGVVTVAIERRGTDLRISVADRGVGIPEEFHSRIFGKFAQADSSDTRQKGGSGLGLSITKALVERMGGQIGFTSELGAGTVFYVDLPECR
jgi:PAS domain S-box-containing protein